MYMLYGLAAILVLSIILIAPFFFGKYTWYNPDGESCWVNDESDKATVDETGVDGEKNIAETWHMWFLITLIFMGVNLALCLLLYVSIEFSDEIDCNERGVTNVAKVTVFTLFSSQIGLAIWGSIIRFGRDGRIASEDCLSSSGTFILVWVII